jgi:hypothetical protein
MVFIRLFHQGLFQVVVLDVIMFQYCWLGSTGNCSLVRGLGWRVEVEEWVVSG